MISEEEYWESSIRGRAARFSLCRCTCPESTYHSETTSGNSDCSLVEDHCQWEHEDLCDVISRHEHGFNLSPFCTLIELYRTWFCRISLRECCCSIVKCTPEILTSVALFENLKLLTSISLDKFKTKRKNRVPDFLYSLLNVYMKGIIWIHVRWWN